MKSVKPGRAPSFMTGVRCIFIAVIGVIWTISAFSMGAGVFSLVGIAFVGIAIVDAIYNFKNATAKERYSQFDITDSAEEADPLNERFSAEPTLSVNNYDEKCYCPYCGNKAKEDYEFCNYCGKKLP